MCRKKKTICFDSKAAISILFRINDVGLTMLEKLSKSNKVTLMWGLGSHGMYSNEVADSLVKDESANGPNDQIALFATCKITINKLMERKHLIRWSACENCR